MIGLCDQHFGYDKTKAIERLLQRVSSILLVCLRKPPDVVANTRKRRGNYRRPFSSGSLVDSQQSTPRNRVYVSEHV